MSDVVVFAGTTEGYEICSFLAKNKVSVLACVATDYGSKSLKEDEYLKIHAGRLNGTEMEKLLKKLSPGLVLDATHPYAAEVTENIRAACQNTGFSYQRVLRPVLIRIRLFMWRIQRQQWNFWKVQKEISCLPQAARSLENLQLYLMQENAFMPVFCLCHL